MQLVNRRIEGSRKGCWFCIRTSDWCPLISTSMRPSTQPSSPTTANGSNFTASFWTQLVFRATNTAASIQLGAMSGIELAQRLSAEGGHIPVIFITAHDDPEARAEAEAVGCVAYFRKTAPGSEVLEVIRRVAA